MAVVSVDGNSLEAKAFRYSPIRLDFHG